MIRIVAYNLSGALDAGAVVEVLTMLRPDVVLAVELPARRGLHRIAARSELGVSSRAGRRRLGAAVLTARRVNVLSHARYDLETPERVPARAAAQAIAVVGGLKLSVVAVQLGLRPEIRRAHARELEQRLARVEGATVLGGDFNETPGGPATGRFAAVLRDAFAVAGEGRGETYPNPDPSARRDLIFVSRGLDVARCYVPAEHPVGVASQHRPVVVDLAGPREQLEPTRVEEFAA